MSVKRFIGITQRIYEHDEYSELRETLALEWAKFFKEYLPDFLMLPLSSALDFKEYQPYLCGVILSGGNDLSVCNNNKLSQQRDKFENEIIQSCLKDHLPLLGVCRGAQLMANYFQSDIVPCKNHVGNHMVVQVDERKKRDRAYYVNSFLLDSQIKPSDKQPLLSIESNSFLVNSFHNYGIKTLGNPLIPLAFSQDDFIEAFRHEKSPFYGIMWHIERNEGMNDQTIFESWLHNIKEK